MGCHTRRAGTSLRLHRHRLKERAQAVSLGLNSKDCYLDSPRNSVEDMTLRMMTLDLGGNVEDMDWTETGHGLDMVEDMDWT